MPTSAGLLTYAARIMSVIKIKLPRKKIKTFILVQGHSSLRDYQSPVEEITTGPDEYKVFLESRDNIFLGVTQFRISAYSANQTKLWTFYCVHQMYFDTRIYDCDFHLPWASIGAA